ncbi:hypothetical protein K7185_13470 [Clostridium butyricum]|uniref:hypothetical protein n=1 Tax=Clostridium butyricum TaxID=1492 RepID=UPI001CA853A5|nr:hypothetical protein [Clostridium butyricum]MBZ0313479.1 hypothetical protein [Clostridium butyricum]
MELQVRISVEVAEMFEELKEYYKKTMGINFSKSDVLIKAVSSVTGDWTDIDWQSINEKKVNVNRYNISEGSLRPKLQITFDIEKKLNDFKDILPQKLNLRSVTLGVCIKHILKFALLEIQEQNKTNLIEDIIKKNENRYLIEQYSEETQLAIKKLATDILLELEDYEIKISKK